MGLLDFLFGSKKEMDSAQPSFQDTSRKDVSFLDNFIKIPSLGFFGQFRRSSSGEWVICWSDSDEQNHRGGNRNSGHGRYVLYNATQNTVALQGKVERPNSGSVADNGNFSIEDWHFGNELSGTFYVFSSAGRKLIEKKFQANLYNSAISDSGRFAVCQTANAPTGEDGNRFTAFDVERNVELFSVSPTTGWADRYTFVEDIPKLGVVINRIGTFYYDIQGNLIDPEKFDTACLHSDRYDVVLLAAEDIVKSPNLNDELANEALKASARALSLGAEKDQGWKAVALKIQGLAYEHLRNNEAAIVAFDAALLINPKIGVKRKADDLRKKLARNERLH
ncbi:MAG: tetratricopeptide repeat protein [Candidatus Omnitrophica bacterium]|nr:tetratricopeptide repeat protein [Candidatus Omnitrophota bacterium]